MKEEEQTWTLTGQSPWCCIVRVWESDNMVIKVKHYSTKMAMEHMEGEQAVSQKALKMCNENINLQIEYKNNLH